MRFVADQAEIGGAVAGPGLEGETLLDVPALGGPVAELAAEKSVLQVPIRRQILSAGLEDFDKFCEMRGAAEKSYRTQFQQQLGLQFGIAGAGGNDGAALQPPRWKW